MPMSNAYCVTVTVLKSGMKQLYICRGPVRQGYIGCPVSQSFMLLAHPFSQNTQFKERWAEEAAMLYERATTVSLSNSLLLHFAFADFEEVCTFHKTSITYLVLHTLSRSHA